ncbi:hypothetical protein K488DRAFT_56638 [Vararia minispora EC-137]|uniref:Uncharacterized protein n=1 Tax=Vararia minispora EC-137 TaxID=1314806 RepID=A0ACB8QCB2_9AGAM|nr:hypothetical protein K488DRAFT_56638 [Vararia minispora EC-137]
MDTLPSRFAILSTTLGFCRLRLQPLARRRVLARILSTFLCAVVILIRPFSKFGGTSAFLCLTLKELVFSVNETLPQQVEATVLNITGAFFGIAISTLARYLSSLCPDDSLSSRSVPAIFLVLVAFIGTLRLSRDALPRLLASARISCFLAIFILTDNPGISNDAYKVPLNFVWIALTSAVICLFSSFIFLPWLSSPFASEVASSFALLRAVLEQRLHEASCDGHSDQSSQSDRTIPPPPSAQALLQHSIQLNAAYAQAAFELRIGRLNVKSLKPFVAIVEYLRRELMWGRTTHKYRHEKETIDALQPAVIELGSAAMEAMEVVERCVRATYRYRLGYPLPLADEEKAVQTVRAKLIEARDHARDQLKRVFDIMGQEGATSQLSLQPSRDRSNYCLFVISLLQMSHEMRQALQIAGDLLALWNSSHTRLWTPRFSRHWLGIAPHQIVTEEQTEVPDDPIPHGPARRMSVPEAQQGIREQRGHRSSVSGAEAARELFRLRVATKHPHGHGPSPLSVYHVWSSESVLAARLALAPIVHSLRHSRHLQHAVKNALGVFLLTLPVFYPTESPPRHAWQQIRGQWMVITYVWVLETNTGATWRVGYLRLSGTILGAIYAYLTWLICRSNPYGLVAMITVLADVPVSYIVTHTRVSSLGVVASVTLPPIAFAEYLSSSLDTSVPLLALWRATMISAGIVAALAVNTLMWPRHCRVLFLRSTSQTLALLSQLYLMLGRNLFLRSKSYSVHDRKKILKLELHIRNCLSRLSYLVVTMNDEVSLMPKPLKEYRKLVMTLQAALDTMTGIRKIRENIPVKEAVASVIEQRREFVSTVCLGLYAGEHAFRGRQSLPQFLPSPAAALAKLVNAIETSICTSQCHAQSLSIVYTFAESEMLKDLVGALEDMLCICRTLFGTATWLHEDGRFQATIGDSDGLGHGGWYSV